jgi:hypothetical protein
MNIKEEAARSYLHRIMRTTKEPAKPVACWPMTCMTWCDVRKLGRKILRLFLVFLPVLGVFLGATVFNRVTPFVFGLPVFFGWTLFTVLMTSLIMFVIYRMDEAARRWDDQR